MKARALKHKSLWDHVSRSLALFGPAQDMPCLLWAATDFPLLFWENRSHICRLWNLGQVNKSLWSFSGIFLWSCTGLDLVSLKQFLVCCSSSFWSAGYGVHFVLPFRSWQQRLFGFFINGLFLCRFGPSGETCFALHNFNLNGLWSLKFWDCSQDYTSMLCGCQKKRVNTCD